MSQRPSCVCANRFQRRRRSRYNNIGFRVARTREHLRPSDAPQAPLWPVDRRRHSGLAGVKRLVAIGAAIVLVAGRQEDLSSAAAATILEY